MKKTLHFHSSTNLKNLIGRDLVTDPITAVFELIKNSYDADATKVEIEFKNLNNGNGVLIIKDNGNGMNLDEIENNWMVIGTDSKKEKEYSEKFNRPLNGDKGIGRFSVDRLGRKLTLYSSKHGQATKIKMKFDWTEFETQYRDMDDIPIPYDEFPDEKSNKGLKLIINELRDIWNFKSVNDLIVNLRKFKSPFSIEDNFRIYVSAPDYDIKKLEIEKYSLEDISSLWIKAKIEKNDTSLIHIEVTKDGVKYEESHKNIYEFGPVESKIFFFNKGDKLRFKNRLGVTVKAYGNIRLFLDDFRIHPYGENFNDWLDLDYRHAQGFSRTFGTRDLIGYVQIYKKHNKSIKPTTNRQGVIQSLHSKQLKQFIVQYPIKIIEKYFFRFKETKNEVFVKSKKQVDNAVIELNKIAKDLKNKSPDTAKLIKKASDLVKRSQSEQAKFVKNQNEIIEVYKRAASQEYLLNKIIHQALINIHSTKSTSANLKDSLDDYKEGLIKTDEFMELISNDIYDLDKVIGITKSYLLAARDNLINKKQKYHIKVKSFVLDILDDFKNQFDTYNILCNCNIPDDLTIYIDKRDFRSIIDNFISNSIKSLLKVDTNNKKIEIKIVKNERFTILNLSDNGIGIPEHLRDRIFDPFFSTTDGFGMGLSIVDELVKSYNGTLYLVKNSNKLGAEFQIKFRRN